jgi:peptidoglycan/LPS O-acetylase OafA/YrhL
MVSRMTDNHSDRRLEHYDALDGLRAIACLVVVTMHTYHFAFGRSLLDLGRPTSGIPKIGVWLFFSLSAFLLGMQLLDRKVSIQDYAIGRVLRILPPLFVAVIVYLYVGTLDIGDWSTALRVMTLQEARGHLWTVPAEMGFYVILPVYVAALALVDGRHRPFAAVAAGVAIVLVFAAAWNPLETPASSIWFPWYMANFASGVLAAFIALRLPHPPIKTARGIGLLAFGLIVAAIVAGKIPVLDLPADWLMNKHFVIGPLWSVATYSVFVAPPAFLRVRPVALIGRWSFSIYLYHWAIGNLMPAILPPSVAFPVALAGSIFAGFVGYHLIEKPTYAARRLITRQATKLRPRPAQRRPEPVDLPQP